MNLLNKLYCVYYVFPPVEDENEFITISKDVHDYLGCSKLHGVFLYKKAAVKLAKKLAKKLSLEIQ